MFAAVEKENIEIVKLLLSNEQIDVNIINISTKYFNYISKQIFQLHFKTNISIEFQNKYFNNISKQIFQ